MRPAGNVDSFIGDDIANYRIAGLTAFTRSDSPRLTRGWKRAINAADHRLLRGTKHVFRVNATAFITRAVLRSTLVTVRFVVTAIFGGRVAFIATRFRFLRRTLFGAWDCRRDGNWWSKEEIMRAGILRRGLLGGIYINV